MEEDLEPFDFPSNDVLLEFDLDTTSVVELKV